MTSTARRSALARVIARVQGLLHVGLARLAFRRTASAAVIAWAAAVVLLLALSDESAPTVALAGESELEDGAAAVRALERETALAVIALALLPVLVARAAGIVPGWRRGDLAWLATRAIGSGTIVVSTWAGTLVAGVALLLVAASAVEARLDAAPSFAFAGTLAQPTEDWLEDGRTLAWSLRDPGPQIRRIRVEVGLGLGAGAAAEIVLRARRLPARAHDRSTDAEHPGSVARDRTPEVDHERAPARDAADAVDAVDATIPASHVATKAGLGRAWIAARGAVEVELPPGDGDVELALTAPDPDARFFLRRGAASAWRPIASERIASLRVVGRAACALAAWLALAIGLAAWMRVATAVALLGASWIPAWSARTPPSWLPGADLFEALAIVGRARVPAAVDPSSLGVAVGLAVIGLVLAALGLRRAKDVT